MVANFAWNSSFMCTTLHYSFWTKAYNLVILFKAFLASSKVALTTSTTPSLEILSCSSINTSSMISWPHTCPKILPSLVTP